MRLLLGGILHPWVCGPDGPPPIVLLPTHRPPVSLLSMSTSAAPRLVTVDPDTPDEAVLAPAAAALAGGALVAFPTETVYGLGANAWDAAAVARVFAAKERPFADPLIVHVLDWAAAQALVDPAALAAAAGDEAAPVARAARLAAAFWPGPLTLVLPKHPRLPGLVTAGQDSVALRAPAHPVARALLRLAAIPVAAPSANPFGGISPTRAADVLADLGSKVDWIVDGGAATLGLESTVVDCRGPRPRILRPGAVTVEALREVLPEVLGPDEVGVGAETASMSAPAASPGLMARHYAPRRARVSLFVGAPAAQRAAMEARAVEAADAGRRVALLVPAEDAADLSAALRDWAARVTVEVLGSRADLAAAARGLYAALRRLDEAGVDVILAADRGAMGLGLALRDRLSRAAEGRVIRV